MRIGYGYDVHRLEEGRPLIVGGVRLEHPVGLQGHSDADVLLHAIADALLGAAALGDIGAHFPDDDPQWEGADSRELLAAVMEAVRAEGYELANVDATLVMERPKLRPHIDAMRAATAEAMGVEVQQIGIKATTSEGLSFVGTEDGAAAHAVCLLTGER